MEWVVKHHEQGLEMCERASKELKNEKLKEFATNAVPAIKEQLKTAKEVLAKVDKGTGAERTGAEAIQVEARCPDRHHLDRAARQPERHRPQRVLPRPVNGEVEAGDDQAFFEAIFDPGHGRVPFRRTSNRTTLDHMPFTSI